MVFFRIFVRENDEFREYAVESLTPYKDAHTLKLRGVDSIPDALPLAGREIFALHEDVAPPAEDEFAVEDLAACRVVTKEGRPVGLVRGVWDTGGTPLLVLDPDGGGMRFTSRLAGASARSSTSKPSGSSSILLTAFLDLNEILI